MRQDIARHPDSTAAEVAKRLQLVGNQAHSALDRLVSTGKLTKGKRPTDDGSRKLNTYRITGTPAPAEPPADKPIPSQPPAHEPPPPPIDGDPLSKALARAEHLVEGDGAPRIEDAGRKALLLHRLAEWPAIDAEIAGALEDIAKDLERFV